MALTRRNLPCATVARAGGNVQTPARKTAGDGQDRAPARGRGGIFPPDRPKTAARNHTIPQKVTDVSICGQLKERGRGLRVGTSAAAPTSAPHFDAQLLYEIRLYLGRDLGYGFLLPFIQRSASSRRST